ncbi:MAG: hypothetical protein AB7O62_18375, partial [Pirellulales bacterium]
IQKYAQAPWHVPVGGGSGEKGRDSKLAEQSATVAVISDSPGRQPATAMLFEHAVDDDAWAVWGLRARWTCKGHVGAQSQTLAIVPARLCL